MGGAARRHCAGSAQHGTAQNALNWLGGLVTGRQGVRDWPKGEAHLTISAELSSLLILII